ncbi:hypothetical protein IMZ48_20625 [Candidatus Bathyarchaeota archaeon]|nr:hypothetical protein [Candidatus Bathyarchaeota archaeon]
MVTLKFEASLEALKPATGPKGLKCLDEKGIPVGDGAHKPAYVDIVDRAIIKSPIACAVLELTKAMLGWIYERIRRGYAQFQVRRNPGGLDRGDVCPNNLGLGILICEITRAS